MDWRMFAEQMATLARDLLAQQTVTSTLERITASAIDLVPGCDGAGILILRDNGVQSLAPTDQRVIDSDRLQERCGKAPATTSPAGTKRSGCSGSPTSGSVTRAGPTTSRAPVSWASAA